MPLSSISDFEVLGCNAHWIVGGLCLDCQVAGVDTKDKATHGVIEHWEKGQEKRPSSGSWILPEVPVVCVKLLTYFIVSVLLLESWRWGGSLGRINLLLLMGNYFFFLKNEHSVLSEHWMFSFLLLQCYFTSCKTPYNVEIVMKVINEWNLMDQMETFAMKYWNDSCIHMLAFYVFSTICLSKLLFSMHFLKWFYDNCT